MKKSLLLLICLLGSVQLFGSHGGGVEGSSSSSSSSGSVQQGLTPAQQKVFDAIRSRSVDEVRASLDSVVDLNFVNKVGNSPLRAAVGRFSIGTVRLLLSSEKLVVSKEDANSLLDVLHERYVKSNSDKYEKMMKNVEHLLVNDGRFRYAETLEIERLTGNSSSSGGGAVVKKNRKKKKIEKILYRTLRGAINSDSKQKVVEVFGNIDWLKVSLNPKISILKGALRRANIGVVSALLKYPIIIEEDRFGLLDFMHEKIDGIKNESNKSGNRMKYLVRLGRLEQLLVNDGRFEYKNTPEDKRLKVIKGSCSSSSSSSGGGSFAGVCNPGQSKRRKPHSVASPDVATLVVQGGPSYLSGGGNVEPGGQSKRLRPDPPAPAVDYPMSNCGPDSSPLVFPDVVTGDFNGGMSSDDVIWDSDDILIPYFDPEGLLGFMSGSDSDGDSDDFLPFSPKS